MVFWGKSFIFDGVPCEDFDLMVYDIGSDGQGDSAFASNVTVVDENVPSRWRNIFYGIKREGKLEFEFTFGVNMNRIDRNAFLDKYEIEAVAAWLTDRDDYKYLEIVQDDMRHVRYRCMISGLNEVSFGNIPWAMKATVTCDSPYAYLYPQVFEYTLGNETPVLFYNESSMGGYYKPKIIYERGASGNCSIVNQSDNGREFKLTGVPAASQSVFIDNENCIITTSDDANVYPKFNYKFLRLKRGYNSLVLSGDGQLKIICEFPINVGG